MMQLVETQNLKTIVFKKQRRAKGVSKIQKELYLLTVFPTCALIQLIFFCNFLPGSSLLHHTDYSTVLIFS